MTFSLGQQIEEVERELRLRPEVYVRRVNRGLMRQSEADYHMDRMRAVLNTLQWLQTNEQRIKDALMECT